jgi:hypothetical protein
MNKREEADTIPGALADLSPGTQDFIAQVDELQARLDAAQRFWQPSVREAIPFVVFMCSHAQAMRAIFEQSDPSGDVAWNAPALAALSRSMLEAYLLFWFHCVEDITPEEKSFRQLLLERHNQYKHYDILGCGDRSEQVSKAMAEARSAFETAHWGVMSHPWFARLGKDVAARLSAHKDAFYYPSFDAIWNAAGLDQGVHRQLHRYMARWAHVSLHAFGEVSDPTPMHVANLCLGQACTQIEAICHRASAHA